MRLTVMSKSNSWTRARYCTGSTKRTVPSMPSMKTSSLSTWKLYDVQFFVSVPSLWSIGFFSLARWFRWQPKQLVIQDVWHVWQVKRSAVWARRSLATAVPHVFPSRCIVFARAALAL